MKGRVVRSLLSWRGHSRAAVSSGGISSGTLFQRRFSIFSRPTAKTQKHSFLSHQGQVEYLPYHQEFPYYSPAVLPWIPMEISDFTFNAKPISATNPYGLITEDTNHRVFRAKLPYQGVYYLKDLSQSKESGQREEKEMQFLSAQESFANWLMYHLFGPYLIPRVFPIIHNNQRGIASSEIKYIGTLSQLGAQLGLTDLALRNGDTPLQVINGETFLLLGKNKDPMRVIGRIALKVALRMLVAHYDVMNHHKNIFMVQVPDPLHYRQVACPGIFDLGCVFCPQQMAALINNSRDPTLKDKLVHDLAVNPVDAHIKELNVEHYDKITKRFVTKHLAFKRIAGLPMEKIELGLSWFRNNAPQEAQGHIEMIREYIITSRAISMEVRDYIAKYLLKNDMLEENLDNEEKLGLKL